MYIDCHACSSRGSLEAELLSSMAQLDIKGLPDESILPMLDSLIAPPKSEEPEVRVPATNGATRQV
jgi:hypothetical protein